jgi:hypothetical protein
MIASITHAGDGSGHTFCKSSCSHDDGYDYEIVDIHFGTLLQLTSWG